MIKLYLVSIIISIMIITIVCFSRSRTSATLDFTFVFYDKIIFWTYTNTKFNNIFRYVVYIYR